MKNFVKSGRMITLLSASRAVASGGGYLYGSLFGVAATDIPLLGAGELSIEGVYTLPKVSAQVWTPGQPIHWDDTAFVCTTSAGGNTLIGVAESPAENPSGSGRVRLNSGFYPALDEAVQRSVDVTISAAQLLALNATPQQVVAAPGAGKAIIPIGLLAYKAAGTAYAGIAAGEDLSLKYTNAAGAEVLQMEATGFLDQAGAQTRWAHPNTANVVPVANAPLVLHLLAGEITTGNSDLKVRVFYRVVPTAL